MAIGSIQDFPELQALVDKVKEKTKAISEQCQHLRTRRAQLRSTVTNTSTGISLLETKSHLLLCYLSNISHFVLLKLEGKQVEDHPVIMRLVELRTVLEKIRPIDQKLKYQIDKLLKLATTPSAVSELDPLRAKPNPANLVSLGDSSASEAEDEDNGGSDGEVGGRDLDSDSQELAAGAGIYVPPRIAAVPYGEDERSRRKTGGDERRYGLNRSMLQELKAEYWDGPEEQKDDHGPGRDLKRSHEDESRTNYEEEHYTRLPGAKKKQVSTSGNSTLTALQFEDFTQKAAGRQGKGKRSLAKKKTKGSFKRKRRH